MHPYMDVVFAKIECYTVINSAHCNGMNQNMQIPTCLVTWQYDIFPDCLIICAGGCLTPGGGPKQPSLKLGLLNELKKKEKAS